MSVNREQLVGRRLKDVAIVMRLDELSAVGRRAAGGCDGRRLQRLAQVREDLTDRPRFRICRPGTVEPHEDSWIAPTFRILLIPTIAFFWDRLGVENDAALGVLRDAITEAMKEKINESPSIKSKMDDVSEAVASVRRELIGDLPKMRRAGRTDVSDLQVTVNEPMPVSEPRYARMGAM